MTKDITLTRVLTRKTALSETCINTLALPALEPGEALLRVDGLALTTNNITYALLGDSMRYWNFFPTGSDGWGQMPAWGFADVIESRAPGVEVGERFYGYYPVASHVRVRPARCSARGFHDAAPHRLELTSAYNHYTRCANDPVYERALEDYQMLLRPLIITSFFGADFLQDNAFFGAQQLVISSASSKTAYGTAFCLGHAEGIQVVGLTSERSRAFVEGLGCYQRVVSYEDLTTLPATTPTTYLDFAGSEELRAKVHHHFGDALKYDCLAGSAQNTDPHHLKTDLPGPKPALYFAPVQIAKRNKEWGYDEVNRRFGEAQRAFIARVSDRTRPWLKLVRHQGVAATAALMSDLAKGKLDPLEGHVVAF
jgi:hypothetical protein